MYACCIKTIEKNGCTEAIISFTSTKDFKQELDLDRSFYMAAICYRSLILTVFAEIAPLH